MYSTQVKCLVPVSLTFYAVLDVSHLAPQLCGLGKKADVGPFIKDHQAAPPLAADRFSLLSDRLTGLRFCSFAATQELPV